MDFSKWQDSFGSNVGSSDLVSIEDRYELLEKVGQGAYGVVWKGVRRKDVSKKTFAIKQINMSRAGSHNLKSVIGEVETMTLLNHPNIVKLEETFKDDTNLWIVMEYLPGGELLQLLKNERLSENLTRLIVVQLLEALEYIHGRGIVHRDLKPSNCLMGENETTVKISDFGFAVLAGSAQCLKAYCGTVAFMAPEILLDKNYGKPVDMWALGIMTYMMFVGGFPFTSDNTHELIRNISRSHEIIQNEPALKYSPHLKDFIMGLLNEDPNKRLTSKEALKHSWIQGIGDGLGLRRSFPQEIQQTFRISKSPQCFRFRYACFAVVAMNRLIYYRKYRALIKIESEQLSVLRNFHYMVSGVFIPKESSLECSEVFNSKPAALELFFVMLSTTTTVECINLSKNNIDSLSVIQNLFKILLRHPSIICVNLSNNPIPALAGRAILRVTKNPICKLRHVILEGTNIPSDILQQINSALKEKANSVISDLNLTEKNVENTVAPEHRSPLSRPQPGGFNSQPSSSSLRRLHSYSSGRPKARSVHLPPLSQNSLAKRDGVQQKIH